jgi:hypothetical protein
MICCIAGAVAVVWSVGLGLLRRTRAGMSSRWFALTAIFATLIVGYMVVHHMSHAAMAHAHMH